MRPTVTVLTRFALIPAALSAGILFAAAPANAAQPQAPRGGETGTLLMPIISSGTHPIEDGSTEFTVEGGISVGWGVAD